MVRNSIRVILCCSLFGVWNAAVPAAPPKTVPGSKLLQLEEELDVAMVAGIDRFALRELAASRARRAAKWSRDYTSPDAYAKSVAANRQRFRAMIGAVDDRIPSADIELIATTQRDSVVAKAKNYTIHRVRWRVLPGVTAEGLLFQPANAPTARIVALPDADWTPEMFAGLADSLENCAPIPKQLAESGCQVLVPTLISRAAKFSRNPLVSDTNQPHREFVYRMAFEMGRHVIGYEVQKVLAAVDIFERLGTDAPIGVVGIGEGGLIALYSAASDSRIDAVWVSGYFNEREGVWAEPIYRNVFGLLTEFGDSDLAGLVAPRGLLIETAVVREITGPPAPKKGQRSGAAPGAITTPDLKAVRREVERARVHFAKLSAEKQLRLVSDGTMTMSAGSRQAISEFTALLGIGKPGPSAALTLSSDAKPDADADARQEQQVDELVEFTQALLRDSARKRDLIWNQTDRSSVEGWTKTSGKLRDWVYDELIGRLRSPTMPHYPRTRLVINEPTHTGYEVVLDVYPDVFAGGILLLPTDLKPGEKRPVVVCQHGLEGTPTSTITYDPNGGFGPYQAFSTELAKRGFIVYAPQNPYRGRDRFRTLQRKSNPMKRSLYSYIIPQHERTLDWLATLPNVDADRIGFYGLSYGGKTAVRVPPFVDRYALSICSADFNEWVRKNVTNTARYSYVFTGEYEIFEWNMGHVANYAELSNLMTPRPFMVERGHRDGVAPDEWVAWEFAKVRRHYDEMGIGQNAEIEFFNGPHMINGKATFDFLHRHLNWPKR